MVRSSGAFDRFAKYINIQPVVVPELKFCDVQRQIFAANLMEIAHDPALDERQNPSMV